MLVTLPVTLTPLFRFDTVNTPALDRVLRTCSVTRTARNGTAFWEATQSRPSPACPAGEGLRPLGSRGQTLVGGVALRWAITLVGVVTLVGGVYSGECCVCTCVESRIACRP